MVRVVGRRNDDPRARTSDPGDQRNAGSRQDAHEFGVRAGRTDPGHKGMGDHVPRLTRVLADDDACLPPFLSAQTGDSPPDIKRYFSCHWITICYTSDSVCSEQFWHDYMFYES
jgi:hypothetical protein